MIGKDVEILTVYVASFSVICASDEKWYFKDFSVNKSTKNLK